jgi:hypothetical protein
MKKRWCILVGLLPYLLMVPIAALIIGGFNIFGLSEWIVKSSTDPLTTLWSVSICLSSIVYGLCKWLFRTLPKIEKLGNLEINVGFIKFNLKEFRIKAIDSCLFSLPHLALIIFFALGMIAFFLTRLPCQPPVVVVTAIYDGEVKQISVGSTYSTTFASALFSVKTLGMAKITCKWEYTGDAITAMPNTGCDVQTMFSQNPGDIAVVTLRARDGFCSQESVFSYFVNMK